MPIVELPAGALDIVEPKAVPEGDYELQIIKSELVKSSNGFPMNTLTVVIVEHQDEALPVYERLNLPRGGGYEWDHLFILTLRRACQASSVEISDTNPPVYDSDDFAGQTFKGRLNVGADQNGEPQNQIVWPKLKD